MTARPRARLALAAVLFVGWLGWLGYAALVKSRAPVVSRSQAAVVAGEPRTAAVVAEVAAGPDGAPASAVKVTRRLAGDPEPGAELVVPNLAEATGFAGPGEYLLLLADRGAGYELVPPPPSPGYELAGTPPLVYRWSPDVEKQIDRLLPR